MTGKHLSFPLRVFACALAAGLCALTFVFGMSLLPSSPPPLWLPLLAALGGGGLCAWFCFAPRAFRRQKTFRLWGARLGAVLCAALLLTLALELCCFNHRAFTTRSCQPEALPLDYFTDEQGEYLSPEGDPIPLYDSDPAMPGVCRLYIADVLEVETVAIRCRFSGAKTPVELHVLLKDEANAHSFVDATNGYALPASALDCFEGALYSNGPLYALCLQLSYAPGAEIWLEEAELDPQIAVMWQPLRMGLCFVGLCLLLCMARFPWQQVAYRRERLSHRLVIALPMALLMLLNGTLCVLSFPEDGTGAPLRGLLNGISVESVAPSDAYGQLFAAFRQGQTALLTQPEEALLALENPYDPSLRAANGIYDYLYDFALYNGSYYVYFGPGPVLLTYYPYYWLTGRIPSESLCALFLSLLAIPLCAYAVLGFVEKYGRRPNLFLLALGCLAAACAAGWPMLATSGSRYENAVACNVAMMAGALGFGWHACAQKAGWRRKALFLLCGVCFGVQAMCRANALLVTTACLAPAFVGVLANKAAPLRRRLTDGVAFLLPALTGVGLVMAYNYARFGSVAEFGQLYQLTKEDIRFNVMRAEYLPQALWHNLLDFPVIQSVFPYLQQHTDYQNVTGNYFWNFANVGLLSYPLLWLLFLLRPSLRRYRGDAPALGRERGASCVLPLLMAVVLMEITYFYAGLLQRYTLDYLFALALVAVFAGLSLCAVPEEPGGEAGPGNALFAALCAVTVLLCVLLGFSNERMNVMNRSPEVFWNLTRMFYPY